MRYIFLLAGLFLFVGCTLDTLDYGKFDRLTWEARLNYKRGDYQKALALFNEAIVQIPKDNSEVYLFAAASAFRLGDSEQAQKLISESIIHTNTDRRYFEEFEEFGAYWGNPVLDDVLTHFDNYRLQYEKNLENPEIKKEVDSIVLISKQIHEGLYDRFAMSRIDSTNLRRLIEITKEYGWYQEAWPILWNRRNQYGSDDWFWNSLKPLIDDEIEKGHLRKYFWAILEDEKQIREEKKQRYGMFPFVYNRFPLEDERRVDQFRKEIGLPPLWYNNEIFGTPLPEGYKSELPPPEQRSLSEYQ